MSTPKARKVIAVIPHYNMPQTLVPLLRQVLGQGYDAVYVLDDHSTNCDISLALQSFGSQVQLIAGAENVGAGRNRNRILQADPAKLQGSILHFMDADMQLITPHAPDIARRLCADNTVGQIGGLILDADGMQYMHNFNPRISWSWYVKVTTQGALAVYGKKHPKAARWLYGLLRSWLRDFPDVFGRPAARDVFCLAEGNFLIPYDVFAQVGGFSDKLRFQEAQDLAYRLEALGLSRRFDPSICMTHLAVQVRDGRRNLDNISGIYTVAREHGMPLR